MLNSSDLRTALIGKTVVTVGPTDGDEGLILTFSDGTILDIGYAGLEGDVKLNGKQVNTDEWDGTSSCERFGIRNPLPEGFR